MKKQDNPQGINRRSFAVAAAAALGSTAGLAQQPQPTGAQGTQAPAPPPASNPDQQRRGTAPEEPPFGPVIEFKRKPVRSRVRPFPMTQVRLLPGICMDAQEWNRGYMMRLGVDRLLHNFRVNAGLPSNAKPLGGWEQPANDQRSSELRGHFTGHYLSACALLYASTGDKEAKARGDEMVAELAKCQAKLGGGYLSAFPTEFFDRLAARKPVWAPFYTIHKIMAGMYDMYRLAGNREALKVLEGMAQWADEWTASKTEEHMQNILNTEYGGMNDVLYDLAAATGEDRWAIAGDRFTKKRFFNPLALRRDELRGLHVNTHIPQVIGAARRYEISGDMRFHDVADFFWYEVTSARCYVTGGTSNGEGWLVQPRRLAAELVRSVATAECCCAYNMMKLTRQLYSWTADPRYFDYYERTLLNHRIGTIQPKTGYTQYYLSHTPGAWKTFNTEDQSFWCCTGTGVEEFAKLNDSIYWQDDDGLYVNLYIASELNWAEKGLRLRQETKYPEANTTSLSITAERPVRMALRVRIPGWVKEAPSVRVNGRAVEAYAGPGSYLVLTRTWQSGDKVEITLPMSLYIEYMPDDVTMQAVLYGPLVLASDLGNEGLTERLIVGPNAPRMRRADAPPPEQGGRPGMGGLPFMEMPTVRAISEDLTQWIRPADQPLTFRTSGQQKDLMLAPLNQIFDRRYSIYWRIA